MQAVAGPLVSPSAMKGRWSGRLISVEGLENVRPGARRLFSDRLPCFGVSPADRGRLTRFRPSRTSRRLARGVGLPTGLSECPEVAGGRTMVGPPFRVSPMPTPSSLTRLTAAYPAARFARFIGHTQASALVCTRHAAAAARNPTAKHTYVRPASAPGDLTA
jgi:hypothetical protein